MAAIDGTPGVEGCILITTLAEGCEMQPAALVTVKLYVFAARPVTVVLTPVPVVDIFPGFLVRVHVPEEGSPLRVTLPVQYHKSAGFLFRQQVPLEKEGQH